MQNGSSKTGRGVMVNGAVSTLKRQPRPKTPSSRQERGSCSSTASCPVFSGCSSDRDEDLPPRCPSSLSSPILHGSRLKGSSSSLQGSVSSLKGSLISLKSFPTSTALQSSSSSVRSSSSSQRSSSEDDSWDTNSWSSGATCLLRSSIKQHSEEVFRVRVGSTSRPEGTSGSETGYQNSDSCPGSVAGAESEEGVEPGAPVHRDSESSTASTASTDLEQKIEEKLKFSQFLDEVTCRVLGPEGLEAFGAPVRPLPSPLLNHTPVSIPWFGSGRNSACDSRDGDVSMYKWAKCMPSCKILDASESLRRTREDTLFLETSGRTYLETDIDRVRREAEVRDVEKRSSAAGQSSRRCPSPGVKLSDGAPRPPYRSTSLPRPTAIITVSDGDACGSSSAQEQKEDLRRRLSCSTHQLQLLEREFESTRQFLEAQLRRAQDQLDKFTEKLRRIQSSYAALQRINQNMEEKIHLTTQRYEEEKRSLNREIVTLNGRLMEAKITIQKLREDNDLYRKDCNLAAQLLQCGKSPYRAHKLSELPVDLQERVSSHMEKQGEGRTAALSHSYSDAVPTAVIGRVLEKPEPGRSCPVTRAPSPQVQEFVCGTDRVQRRGAYRSSDLYCSDTALYCPADDKRRERWPERRQSADHSGHTSDPEDDGFPLSFSPLDEPFHGFMLGSLPASSCYTSLSAASDGKPRGPASSQQPLLHWHQENREKPSSYRKGNLGFSKSTSVQQVSSQNGVSPAPRVSGALGLKEPTDGWRQRSAEDLNALSFSPFGLSERRFSSRIGPAPLYGSLRDGEHVFHMRFPALKERGRALGSKDASTASFFITKDKENTTEDALQRDYADHSPGSSVESLDVQLYKKDLGAQKHTPQKLGNTGLSRKDSLTKAQLYGTLLN